MLSAGFKGSDCHASTSLHMRWYGDGSRAILNKKVKEKEFSLLDSGAYCAIKVFWINFNVNCFGIRLVLS